MHCDGDVSAYVMAVMSLGTFMSWESLGEKQMNQLRAILQRYRAAHHAAEKERYLAIQRKKSAKEVN